MSRDTCLFLVLFFFMALVLLGGALVPAQAKPPLNLAVKRQEFRNSYIQFESIIDGLGVNRGMTILDIGSGPGYASFLFAEKLQGTGAVFATEIRADFVKYIAEEAKSRGLTNLFSAVVKEKGLDEFYGKHRYDLVFMANTYHCIDNRIEYFGSLRNFLNPGARLVFVLYNQAPLFVFDDLADAEGLVKILAASPPDDPFVRHLSDSTRRLLEGKAGDDVLARALIEELNRMLIDPRFYTGFYSGSYLRIENLTASERELCNWLLLTLKEDGVLDRPVDQIDGKAMRSIIKLNRLLVRKRFGAYLAKDGMGVYLPAGDANRNTSKYEMVRELGTAGYMLDREMTVSPYFDALIMVPTSP